MSGSDANVLIVVPARGGSKGIPRKNLRRLGGKPLIFYVLESIKNLPIDADLVVSTEDEEILNFVQQLGVECIRRPEPLSEDHITLDSVVYHATKVRERERGKQYNYVGTCQPTSPLIETSSLMRAIELVESPQVDTVITVVSDAHLAWRYENGSFVPAYKERLNRQYLEQEYRETGGFLLTARDKISENSRIGQNVSPLVLNFEESIDIDNECDWAVCEYLINRKRIVFSIVGNSLVGMGHVYNSLILACDLVGHEIIFVIDVENDLAVNRIKSDNYQVIECTPKAVIQTITNLNPDVVINDRLDTDIDFMDRIRNDGMKIINFEDLGEGASRADLVVNAIYPESICDAEHYSGHNYYLLRDEFSAITPQKPQFSVRSVLITFGGTDPSDLTEMVLREIREYCQSNNIEITVVLGFGKTDLPSDLKVGIALVRSTSQMSAYMGRADIIFTSAGRTVYEVAATGTPAVVLCQNTRELTHSFASSENGFINLGLGSDLSSGKIGQVFSELCSDTNRRRLMSTRMLQHDLTGGRARVLNLIKSTIYSE